MRRIAWLSVALAAAGLVAVAPAQTRNPFAPPAAQPAAAPPKKVALLIGVNDYEHRDLADLRYAEADVTALRTVLVGSGYRVTVLTGKDATRKAILSALEGFHKEAQGAAVAVVGFAGHGIQPEESMEAYLCPYDAGQTVVERAGRFESEWDLAGTTLPLSVVIARLKASGAASRAILVDACRNDPKTGRGGSRSAGFGSGYNVGDLPDNLALMLSCSKDEKAWEDPKWGHGAFFRHVLKGIAEGKATLGGAVSANSLAAYLTPAVKQEVSTVIGDGAKQNPHAIINGHVDFLIVPNAGTYRVSPTTGARFVRIKAGTFTMGSPKDEADRDDDETEHKVTFEKDFYLGEYEVTRGEFAKFVADTGYKTEAERDGHGGWGYDPKTGKFEGPSYNVKESKWEGTDTTYSWRSTGWEQADTHPVVNVSWADAVAFAGWLSRKDGVAYRLPRESEWEYACRAGSRTRYTFGDDPEGLAGHGNVVDGTAKAKFPGWTTIAAKDGYVFTSPVGTYRANGFGLYDMHGNVWEWCSDWYGSYPGGEVTDPIGPTTGSFRVIRGGGWNDTAWNGRSASRISLAPSCRYNGLGFRLALVPSGQ